MIKNLSVYGLLACIEVNENMNSWSLLIKGKSCNFQLSGEPDRTRGHFYLIPVFVFNGIRRNSPERGLGGYSLGGLFSLYVLLTQPELFTIYFAGSPSIGYDKGVLFRIEEKYASANKDMKVKLLMTFGSLEDTTNMKKMAQVLLSRNYPGLSVTTHVFPGENHQSCFPSAIMKALRILYKR